MAQGTQRSNNRPQLIEDLDTLITSRSLRPGKVKFGGRYWTIKRDFTGQQVLDFWRLAATAQGTVDAYKMLFGENDGPEFHKLTENSPMELVSPALRKIYQHAGLLKRIEEPESADDDGTDVAEEEKGEGESSAS